MKKLVLSFIIIASLLITACSTSEEKIQDGDFVLIINNAPKDVCDLNILENEIIDNILPYATLEVLEDSDSNVTCASYQPDTQLCREVSYGLDGGDVSCVIGADTEGLFENIQDIIDLIKSLT